VLAVFTPIVVPVDLSDRHRPALDLAARLVGRDWGMGSPSWSS
jgi:hypothetical protein